MSEKSGKYLDAVNHMILTVIVLCLIIAALSPLTRARMMIQASMFLQQVARRTGEAAIMLELGARDQVQL